VEDIMEYRWVKLAGLLVALILFSAACDDGIDDWNSSAKITGWVFADPSNSRGIEGVQVIIEADPEAETPYEGPDRWTVTDGSGHYEGAVFLGRTATDYNWVADLSVAYFWHGKSFAWSGGISVSPGSVFTLPPVDTTMFSSVSGQ
jgi:hypothetical protein